MPISRRLALRALPDSAVISVPKTKTLPAVGSNLPDPLEPMMLTN